MKNEQPHSDGLERLNVELTNICNLHCSYCLRDEDALYHSRANFFSVDLLSRIMREAREVAGIKHLSFTGGEATLHPRFDEIFRAVDEAGLTASFVTNGWRFERIYPMLLSHRRTLSHISFSLDGATREAHDHWRGRDSFNRLVRAFTRCRVGGIPFTVKVGIRRDTVPQFEQIAIFAARMGATALSFAHVLPTSAAVERESGLSLEMQKQAEEEIATLSSLFKMRIQIDVGYYNVNPDPPCLPLAGTTCNINYLGHLSLCCNLSGFRGANGEADVVADLNTESFAAAYERLRDVAARQLQRRADALEELAKSGQVADLYTGVPCLFCLRSLGKIPWQPDGGSSLGTRSLPVLSNA
ncbi:MAG TPA: radical SAM protein [Pyrinomonadaceae bacterium]|jgi:MoaA/NifB/PqqE/SkfB family radical SAM enzyme|nr:radical SAM protein [Pyrinomonadaceae bacterium]